MNERRYSPPERLPAIADKVMEQKGVVIYARRKGWKMVLSSPDGGRIFRLKITDDRGQEDILEFNDFDLTEITGYSQLEAMEMVRTGQMA